MENIHREGFSRVRIDDVMYNLDDGDEIKLEKTKKHTIEVVVDRLAIREGIRQRLAESMETALKLGEGVVYVQIVDGELMMFSQNFACADCGIILPEIAPRMFSFNSPFGACPACSGLGSNMEFDLDLILQDKNLSLAQGAIQVIGINTKSYAMCQMGAYFEKHGYYLDIP